MDKEYSFESLLDVEEDIEDAIKNYGLPGDFKGVLKITVSYQDEEK